MGNLFIFLLMRELVSDSLCSLLVVSPLFIYLFILILMVYLVSSGSGFVSQDLYLHGFFSASIKLPADYTAGVVVAFYVSALFSLISFVYFFYHPWLIFKFFLLS